MGGKSQSKKNKKKEQKKDSQPEPSPKHQSSNNQNQLEEAKHEDPQDERSTKNRSFEAKHKPSQDDPSPQKKLKADQKQPEVKLEEEEYEIIGKKGDDPNQKREEVKREVSEGFIFVLFKVKEWNLKDRKVEIMKYHPNIKYLSFELNQWRASSGYSIDRDIRVWSYHTRFDVDEFQIYMEKHRTYWRNLKCYEEYGTFRPIQRQKFQFEFNVRLKENVIECVLNPYEQLCFYSLFLLENGVTEAIPLLVEQFWIYFEKKQLQDSIPQRFIQCLISASNKLGLTNVYDSVIALLGLVPIKQHHLIEARPLIAQLRSDSKGLLRSFGEETIYSRTLIRGISSLLLKERGNSWGDILVQVENQPAKVEIAKKLARLANQIQGEEAMLLISILKLTSESRKFIKGLIPKLKDFEMIVGLTNEFYQNEDEACRLEDKDLEEIFKTYAECMSLSITKIANMVRVLHENQRVRVFARAYLSTKFRGYLNYSIKPGEYTPENLELLKKVFNEYYDQQLLEGVNKESISREFLSKGRSRLSEVLELKPQSYERIIEDWISRKVRDSRDKQRLMELLVEEMNLLRDDDYKRCFLNKAIEILLRHSRNGYFTKGSLCEVIGNHAPQAFQDLFLQELMRTILTQREFEDLLQLQEKHPANTLISNAIGYYLARQNGGRVAFEEIKQELLGNPSKGHYWFSLLRLHERLHGNTFIRDLVHGISQLFNYIQTGALAIHEVLHLKNQSQDQKENLVAYLELALIVQGQFQQDLVRNTLNQAFTQVEDIRNQVEKVRTFLEFLCQGAQDHQATMDAFNQFNRNYHNNQVSQYTVDQNLQCFVQPSNQYSRFAHCYAFKNCYLTRFRPAQYTCQQVINLCNNAYYNMQQELTGIINNLENTQLSQLLDIYDGAVNIEKELEIIKKMLNPSMEVLSDLGECLTYSSKKELKALKDHSVAIISMQELFGLQDDTVLGICENFRMSANNVRSMSIAGFLMTLRTLNQHTNLLEEKSQEIVNSRLKVLSSSKDLIKSLQTIKEDEIEHMKEGVNDFEEDSYITTQVVFDLENVYYFVKDLYDLPSYEELCQKLLEKENDPRNKGIIGQMRSCMSQISGIMEEAKKIQIQKFFKYYGFQVHDYSWHNYIQFLSGRSPNLSKVFASSDCPKCAYCRTDANFMCKCNSSYLCIKHLGLHYESYEFEQHVMESLVSSREKNDSKVCKSLTTIKTSLNLLKQRAYDITNQVKLAVDETCREEIAKLNSFESQIHQIENDLVYLDHSSSLSEYLLYWNQQDIAKSIRSYESDGLAIMGKLFNTNLKSRFILQKEELRLPAYSSRYHFKFLEGKLKITDLETTTESSISIPKPVNSEMGSYIHHCTLPNRNLFVLGSEKAVILDPQTMHLEATVALPTQLSKAFYNQGLVYCLSNSASLYKYDLNSKEWRILFKLPEKLPDSQWVSYKGNLLLTSNSTDKVYQYNPKENRFEQKLVLEGSKILCREAQNVYILGTTKSYRINERTGDCLEIPAQLPEECSEPVVYKGRIHFEAGRSINLT